MKYSIIILAFLLLACNSQQQHEKSDVKSSTEHAGHEMPAGSGNYCDSVNAGLISADTLRSSPNRVAMNTVNGTHVHIEYASPGVKGRVIWGGLVAYDKVWVTGAHNATAVSFSKPVLIAGKTIPKGTYGFFTIPGRKEWQVIINSRYEQHLADDYSAEEDLVRTTVTPTTSAMTPRLTYFVKPAGKEEGEIIMQWEKLQISLPFKTMIQ